MTTLAVAAVSARMMAEAVRDDGFPVVALDLFGDADTRRACTHWHAIGEPHRLEIDGDRLLRALDALARDRCAVGWIAGAGFEGRADLLERGAARLRLIGTGADAMRRLRDPAVFFDVLAEHGIAHPPVRMAAPPERAGWLLKNAHGCGGWHVRRADLLGADDLDEARAPLYFQREVAGRPMSATFVANGQDACVLGFNQLNVRPMGALPFVFCGAIGPVALPAGVGARVTAAVRVLAAAFALRGLGSLDFMLDGDAFQVLEVNARPPASMALYAWRRGLMAAHVRACLDGVLPRWPAPSPQIQSQAVRGTEIVYAPRRVQLDEAAVRQLACAGGGRHDLPAAAGVFEAGAPLCSVSACAASAQAVRALLARERDAVHQCLENIA